MSDKNSKLECHLLYHENINMVIINIRWEEKGKKKSDEVFQRSSTTRQSGSPFKQSVRRVCTGDRHEGSNRVL